MNADYGLDGGPERRRNDSRTRIEKDGLAIASQSDMLGRAKRCVHGADRASGLHEPIIVRDRDIPEAFTRQVRLDR